MFLLVTATLCCVAVAATLALFEPVFGQGPEQRIADSTPVDVSAHAPVRVVGAPFIPNTNPRQR